MAVTPEVWFKTMPPVTKTYFVAVLATTILTAMGVVDGKFLYLNFDLVFKKFELWRLVTNFIFFGPFSLPWVFTVFILVRHTRQLEDRHYVGNSGTAEMVTMMLFGAVLQLTVAFFWGTMYFLSRSMMFHIIYIWSRKDPYQQVSVWGFAFKAWHFPYVLLIVGLLFGGSPVLGILGILTGHLFHFISDIVPRLYGVRLIRTPQFMYNLFERQNVAARYSNWQQSQGHRLG